jgi:hypothetical protein
MQPDASFASVALAARQFAASPPQSFRGNSQISAMFACIGQPPRTLTRDFTFLRFEYTTDSEQVSRTPSSGRHLSERPHGYSATKRPAHQRRRGGDVRRLGTYTYVAENRDRTPISLSQKSPNGDTSPNRQLREDTHRLVQV